jgi:hypothetical protein
MHHYWPHRHRRCKDGGADRAELGISGFSFQGYFGRPPLVFYAAVRFGLAHQRRFRCLQRGIHVKAAVPNNRGRSPAWNHVIIE